MVIREAFTFWWHHISNKKKVVNIVFTTFFYCLQTVETILQAFIFIFIETVGVQMR